MSRYGMKWWATAILWLIFLVPAAAQTKPSDSFQHQQRAVIVESVGHEMRAERQIEIAPRHRHRAQILARAQQIGVARAVDEQAALKYRRVGNRRHALEHRIEGQQAKCFRTPRQVDVDVAALVAKHIDVLAAFGIDMVTVLNLAQFLLIFREHPIDLKHQIARRQDFRMIGHLEVGFSWVARENQRP